MHFISPLGHCELICVISAPHPPPRSCTSSRSSTFKQRPKDLTFALKSKEKKVNHQVNCSEMKRILGCGISTKTRVLLHNAIQTVCATISTQLTETTVRKFKQTAPSSKQFSSFRHKYTYIYVSRRGYWLQWISTQNTAKPHLTTLLASLYSVYLYYKNELKH